MRDLQIGGSALINFQRAMDVTAHNIANAATPGYSRQRPEFESVEGQRFGRAYYGNGATIRTVTRSSDAFLEREANRTSSLAAGPNQRLESLKALESLVPTGPNGLQTMLSDAASAWNDVVGCTYQCGLIFTAHFAVNGGGIHRKALMGANVMRWIPQGPWLAKAAWCWGVPYPMCAAKPYWG